MNPQEYRIGNFAEDQHGNLLRVVELSETYVIFSVVDRSKFPLAPGWQAQPIPIADDHMLKLGFIKIPGKEGYVWTIKAKLSFGSEFQIGEAGSYKFFQFGEKYSSIKITHVHQLQNLYAAIAGEDLATHAPNSSQS